jgi:hypothetical protein
MIATSTKPNKNPYLSPEVKLVFFIFKRYLVGIGVARLTASEIEPTGHSQPQKTGPAKNAAKTTVSMKAAATEPISM